jgi:single-stranded-DNA-specific exonuclease
VIEPHELGAIWIEPKSFTADLASLHENLLLAQLLAHRGIRTRAEANRFLHPRPQSTPSPSRLPNLKAAIDRVETALDAGEKIAVFGDYDVDGITSTAILVSSLRTMAASADLISMRLPIRSEGYGLTIEAVETFVSHGITLLIAVDCGSNDHASIARARELGLDVVVFDHHQINGPTPEGAIIVSAQLGADDELRELSAVGVAFLAVCELSRRGRALPPGGDVALLDLVALGTIADVVPMLGVNRALVRDGLVWVRKGARAGLRALMRKAGVRPESVDSETISFKLVPRINAAGRLADPQLAYDLLMAPSERAAGQFVDELERLNERRRDGSKAILDDVAGMVSADLACLDAPLLVFSSERWPAGLAGPAAAKLSERYRRPVVVLAEDGELLHGSARSTPGFDIAGAFATLTGLLERHGGHKQAAGLTVQRARLLELRQELTALAGAPGADLSRETFEIEADLEANGLELTTAQLIEELQPFGHSNPRPLLRVRDLKVQRTEIIGQDRSHLRLILNNGANSVKAVMFGGGARQSQAPSGSRIDVVGRLGIDHWNGAERLDLKVADFRPT